MALEHNLVLIPVLNKIDLPSADVETCAEEIENILGISKSEIIAISAKEGTNVEKVLEAVIERVPPPKDSMEGDETKGLIFDSVYDSYRGVVSYIRLMTGSLKRGDKIFLLQNQRELEVLEVGYFKPKLTASEILESGEVGYVVTGLKNVAEARVGDTIWKPGTVAFDLSQAKPLEGYKEVKPYVFASIFCVEGDDYPLLRDALLKLQLSDSALSFEPEQSRRFGARVQVRIFGPAASGYCSGKA